VRRRQHDPVALDPRGGHALGDLLRERVRHAAKVGLHERELAARRLENDRSRTHARVDAAARDERLGVHVLVGVGDDLHRQLRCVARIGDAGARRVGEHRGGDRRRDVDVRDAGPQGGGRVGAAGAGVDAQAPAGALATGGDGDGGGAALLDGRTPAIGQLQARRAPAGPLEAHGPGPDYRAAPARGDAHRAGPVGDDLDAQDAVAQHRPLALVDHARLRGARRRSEGDRCQHGQRREPAQYASHAREYEAAGNSARQTRTQSRSGHSPGRAVRGRARVRRHGPIS
jgi:hypothetical protein